MRCAFRVLVVDLILALLGVLVIAMVITRSAVPPFTDPYPDSSFKIAALGDSYISGEGAEQFFAGTDRPGMNTCRRAPTAYPMLVAKALKASLVFAACSGAKTKDITDRGQESVVDPEVPGGEPQIQILRRHADASVILLSIGGNDAEFATIARGCTYGGDCRRNADFWVQALQDDVYPRLVATYRMIQESAPHAQLFVLNYPNPLGPKSCAELPMDAAEASFLRDVFLPRLNQLIDYAAVYAHVRTIDISNAFDKSRICEGPGSAAVNVLGFRRTRGDGSIDVLDWGHNSFHPNALGHSLIAEIVTATLHQFMAGSLPPLPEGAPPEPIPFVPPGISVPIGPYPFPTGSACTGKDVARIVPVAAPKDKDRLYFRIPDAKIDSRVCYHGFEEAWESKNASSTGEVVLGLDTSRPGFGSTSEVLYQTANGVWIKIVVSRVDHASTETNAFDPVAILGFVWLLIIDLNPTALLGLGAAMVIVLAVNGLAIIHCRRRSLRPSAGGRGSSA